MQSFDYKKSYGTLIYDSKWENEINFPSNKFLLKLCDVLEIEVKELLKLKY